MLRAEDKNERIDFLDPYVEKLTFGPLKIGGSVAFEYRYRSYGREDTGAGDFDFLNAKLNVSFNQGPYTAQAKYGFYYYENPSRWVHWLQFAWIGYTFSPDHQVRLGIQKVPFGLLPLSSFSWYENLSYYVGLEDDNDLGIKYIGKFGRWDLRLGYYLQDEGSYTGESKDSARYSFYVVRDAGSGNQEENQFNLRLAYNFIHSPTASTELGVSLQYGQIRNVDTNQDGDHYALAMHMGGRYDAWRLKLAAMRHEYHPENPAGVDDDVVIIGAFDFPYEVAAKATLFETSLGYQIPLNKTASKTVLPYVEYGIMVKDKSTWRDTQFVALGAVWNLGRLYIYSDLYYAQGHPYIGPDTFFTGLSSGSGNSDWHSRINVNISYGF